MWVFEDGEQALLQVAHWAQGILEAGGQVRLDGQLLGEEIPADPGTCSLLEGGKSELGQVMASCNPPSCLSALELLY